jgi:hypothetical protein
MIVSSGPCCSLLSRLPSASLTPGSKPPTQRRRSPHRTVGRACSAPSLLDRMLRLVSPDPSWPGALPRHSCMPWRRPQSLCARCSSDAARGRAVRPRSAPADPRQDVPSAEDYVGRPPRGSARTDHSTWCRGKGIEPARSHTCHFALPVARTFSPCSAPPLRGLLAARPANAEGRGWRSTAKCAATRWRCGSGSGCAAARAAALGVRPRPCEAW